MTEFAYNNTENTITAHNPFELNYGYYPKVLFKENVDYRLKSCSTNKLAK